jgi:hypothetical protein
MANLRLKFTRMKGVASTGRMKGVASTAAIRSASVAVGTMVGAAVSIATGVVELPATRLYCGKNCVARIIPTNTKTNAPSLLPQQNPDRPRCFPHRFWLLFDNRNGSWRATTAKQDSTIPMMMLPVILRFNVVRIAPSDCPCAIAWSREDNSTPC